MTPAIPDLRPYLTAAYSDEELTTLCADYFRDVYENFAAGMTKAQKIRLLLDHCQHRDLLPNLAAALERDRPEQYQRYFGAEGGDRPARTRHQRNPRQVFVSHAHQDTEFAHRLAADLQQRGWQAWIAPDSIRRVRNGSRRSTGGWPRAAFSWWRSPPRRLTLSGLRMRPTSAIMLTNKGKMRFIPAEVASCDAPPLWEVYHWIPFTVRYADGLAALLVALGGETAKATETVLMQPDPWSTAEDDYKPGELVEAVVTSVNDFGAFVRTRTGVEGLLHVTEMADIRPDHPQSW